MTTGTAWGRNHRRIAVIGARRRRPHRGIDIARRTQNAIRFRERVAQRLRPLPGRRTAGSNRPLRGRLCRRAIGICTLCSWWCGLSGWRSRRWRRLREGSAGTGDDKTCDDKRLFDLHLEQTAGANRGSGLALQQSGFNVADQRKMPHRRHRPALGQPDPAMHRRPIH